MEKSNNIKSLTNGQRLIVVKAVLPTKDFLIRSSIVVQRNLVARSVGDKTFIAHPMTCKKLTSPDHNPMSARYNLADFGKFFVKNGVLRYIANDCDDIGIVVEQVATRIRERFLLLSAQLELDAARARDLAIIDVNPDVVDVD